MAEIKAKKKCPVIVLCLLFAAWFLFVPGVLGIILYIRNIMVDKENKKAALCELDNLRNEINKCRSEKAACEEEYNKAVSNKEELLLVYRTQAKEEALKEAKEQLDTLENTIKQLEQDISVKQLTLDELTQKYNDTSKNVESNANKVIKLKEIYKSFQYAIKTYESGDSIIDELLITDTENYLMPIVETHLNCLNVKQLKARYNAEQRNIQEAFKRYEGRYTTKTNAAIYKLMVIALEAELQNVLFTLKFGKLEDSISNIKQITLRYLAIAIDGNQSIAPTMKKFIGEVEYLFIEAVKIEYEYYTQRERIKEEQRALKEQMRQEAEERKKLEQERKQIEREEAKYVTEIDAVNQQLAACSDNGQISVLQARIQELTEQLHAVKGKKDKILTLQNGKAGYVYVISNLGSFGENVFKVGMTRRSEPMDRIRELGDASVPFSFDVHSFIFSDDAVSLETTLHHELNSKRVNKINLRKEFFKVTLDEIEELVYKYQPSAEFNRTMLAEEYRQGLSMEGEPTELDEYDLVYAGAED